MSIDTIFPFYGKIQNDEEVYIACLYDPVFSLPARPPGYRSSDGNKRLAFLSYLPLTIPDPNDDYTKNLQTPNIYPTTNARKQLVSFDLLFTPASQAASVFKVKNVCNNSFELFYNNLPVYISDTLYQFDLFQFSSQELYSGNMFTITKANDSDNNKYTNNLYEYSTFYGVFQLLFQMSPVYRVACLPGNCGCDGNEEPNCCIPDNSSSLSINTLCFQTNSINISMPILIIPKKSRYISINNVIYEDNTTIYNFLFTWDSIVNNNLQAPYIYYSPSLFKSLEISKKTYNIKYCIGDELCGDNGGCYGSCNTDCLSNSDGECFNINGLSECLSPSDLDPEDNDGAIFNFDTFTIITIIFTVLLAICIGVFLIVIFTKSKKQVNVKPTYNITIYENEEEI